MAHLDRATVRKSQEQQAKAQNDETHRLRVVGLALLLAAIFCWCLLLLFKSLDLRRDLANRQRSMEQIRSLRSVLQRPVSDVVTTQDWPRLQVSVRMLESLLDYDSEGLRGAAERLQGGAEQLHKALIFNAEDGGEAAEEKVWDASFGVLKALTSLEGHLQGEIDTIYAQLSDHWRSLNWLVMICLLLCASNLALLHLTQRRRILLEEAHARALELATHDSLTGLWNRESILTMVRREISRAKRLKMPLGVILADIDHFRRINGLVGQEQGDEILRQVSKRLGSLVRPYDTMGRFSGDSFLVVLPTCDAVATANVADRLRYSIQDREVEYGLGKMGLTLSIVHLTVDHPEETDMDLVLHRLQEGLEELKASPDRGRIQAMSAAHKAVGVRSKEP